MKNEDRELGCDDAGNCAYFSARRGVFYARRPDGSSMGPKDVRKLLKRVGWSVTGKGNKVRVRYKG